MGMAVFILAGATFALSAWRGWHLWRLTGELERARSFLMAEAMIHDFRVGRRNGKGATLMHAEFALPDGRRFGVRRFAVGNLLRGKAIAEARKVREGELWTVYYDPDNPTDNMACDPRLQSVVWPTIQAIWPAAVGIGILVMG